MNFLKNETLKKLPPKDETWEKECFFLISMLSLLWGSWNHLSILNLGCVYTSDKNSQSCTVWYNLKFKFWREVTEPFNVVYIGEKTVKRTAHIRHQCRNATVLSCHRLTLMFQKQTFKYRLELLPPDVSK